MCVKPNYNTYMHTIMTYLDEIDWISQPNS